MLGNAPEHPMSSVADAMHRSVVTHNYLKKYFGQLQRVYADDIICHCKSAEEARRRGAMERAC